MNTTTPRRFVSAAPTSLGEQLAEHLVAIRPIRVEVVTTKHGDGEATIAEVIEISDHGHPIEHGEIPLFWVVVCEQLKAATPEAPWVAGRLVRVGKAYRLDSLSGPEEALIERALGPVAVA